MGTKLLTLKIFECRETTTVNPDASKDFLSHIVDGTAAIQGEDWLSYARLDFLVVLDEKNNFFGSQNHCFGETDYVAGKLFDDGTASFVVFCVDHAEWQTDYAHEDNGSEVPSLRYFRTYVTISTLGAVFARKKYRRLIGQYLDHQDCGELPNCKQFIAAEKLDDAFICVSNDKRNKVKIDKYAMDEDEVNEILERKGEGDLREEDDDDVIGVKELEIRRAKRARIIEDAEAEKAGKILKEFGGLPTWRKESLKKFLETLEK